MHKGNTASGGYGMLHRPLWCLFTHPTDHMSLWHLYMFTLESVADPRLLDPWVGDDKTYITTMGMQQTYVHGRTTYATGQTGQTAPGDLLHLRQGLLLDLGFWYLHCGY